MNLQAERARIVEYGKKLVERGLTRGTGGNLSIFRPEQDLVAISPSGIDYFETRSEDVSVVELNGVHREGKKPSSELAMHLILYRNRPDIRALVHTHSPFCTTIAALNWSIPPVHYLVGFAGKDVPCARYATYGTEELARNAYEAMQGRKAVLLANHGLLAGGSTLQQAFNVAEEVEFCAEIFYRAKSIGEPVQLDAAEMERIIEKFQEYGPRT